MSPKLLPIVLLVLFVPCFAATLVGMRLAHNSPVQPQLVSIEPMTGNITATGAPLDVLIATSDLRTVVRGVYYAFGDASAGAQLVGVSLKDGSVTCQSTVPVLEIGFVGFGQSLTYDTKHDALILSGLSHNSTGGYDHQILSLALSSSTQTGKTVACGRFKKVATFPFSGATPMLHGSALDPENQLLYTTIDQDKDFALGIVDLAQGTLESVIMETSNPVVGMTWNSQSKKLFGASQTVENVIELVTIDPVNAKITARKLDWGALGSGGGPLLGNEAEVMAFDHQPGAGGNCPAGTMYILVRAKADLQTVTRIATVDWANAVMLDATPALSFPPIAGGQPDPFKEISQMVWTK